MSLNDLIPISERPGGGADATVDPFQPTPFDPTPYDHALQLLRDQQFQATPIQRALEAIYLGSGSLRPPRTRGFGRGLAVGAVRGLAGAGRTVADAREQFREDQRRRRLAIDEARLRAQEQIGTENRAEAREVRKEQRTAKKPATVVVTAELVRQFPALKGSEGQTMASGPGSVFSRLTAGTPVSNRAPRSTRPKGVKPGPVMPELSALSGAYNRAGRAALTTGNLAESERSRRVQSAVDRFHADVRQAQSVEELRAIEFPGGLPEDVLAGFKKALHNRERQIGNGR